MSRGQKIPAWTLWAASLLLIAVGIIAVLKGTEEKPASDQESAVVRSTEQAPTDHTAARPIGNARADCSPDMCQSCGDGTLPASDPCCGKCLVAAAECEAGRGTYATKASEQLEQLEKCESESDCIYASFTDSCRSYCARPLNKLLLGRVVSQLSELSKSHCDSCGPMKFDCPGPSEEKVACQAGRCIVVE